MKKKDISDILEKHFGYQFVDEIIKENIWRNKDETAI